MLERLCQMVDSFIKAQIIKVNKEIGFDYIRDDRGAMEFVARGPEVWTGIHGKIKSPAAYAGYKSIYWPSKTAMSNTAILKHELSHIEDDEKLGYIFARFLYGIFSVVFGYDKNPFEEKARAAERR